MPNNKANNDLSIRIQEFIFRYVDSVDLLSVLFLLRNDPQKAWSAHAIGVELRSNASSAEIRIQHLKSLELIEESKENSKEYFYSPKSDDVVDLIDELFEEYQKRRHRVLELIFSPLKKARDFADAFRLPSPKQKNEGEF